MAHITMDFKDFDDMVKTYYPLNKEKSRYLIYFKAGYSLFYRFDKKNNSLIREDNGVY